MLGYVQAKIRKFSSRLNFEFWKIQISALIIFQIKTLCLLIFTKFKSKNGLPLFCVATIGETSVAYPVKFLLPVPSVCNHAILDTKKSTTGPVINS